MISMLYSQGTKVSSIHIIMTPLPVLIEITFCFKVKKPQVKLSIINWNWLQLIGEEKNIKQSILFLNHTSSFFFCLVLGCKNNGWGPNLSSSQKMRCQQGQFLESCNHIFHGVINYRSMVIHEHLITSICQFL